MVCIILQRIEHGGEQWYVFQRIEHGLRLLLYIILNQALLRNQLLTTRFSVKVNCFGAAQPLVFKFIQTDGTSSQWNSTCLAFVLQLRK